ncbi:MAG: LptF/LptG family permease [Puniceicoccales bacterium]|jgi:lipopolysaccharide export system permease protein|nr:LptF/LptG family permease [Puniceicoccales bacterium]
MNKFQRYMFGQVVLAVFLAVGLFVFVMVTGTLLRDALPMLTKGAIDWLEFFQLLAIAIPGVLPYALPMGLLTGVLIVLGRMSAQNEILAMKTSGLSLWRIISPVFLVALLGVVASLYINFEQAPRANDAFKRIVVGKVRTNPSRLIASGQFTRFNKYVIYADSREGDNLSKVRVWELNSTGKVVRVIHAPSATLVFDIGEGGDGELQFSAHDARVESFNKANPDDFSDVVPSSKAAVLPVSIGLQELLKEKGDYKKKLRYHTLSELMELRRTGWLLSPKATERERYANRIAVQLQIQNNLASALGILSMSMLAIPLGIKSSRSETFVNMAIALLLALTFYVLTVMVSWVKEPSFRPDILVWLPNFLYQAVGFWLLRKAAKT